MKWPKVLIMTTIYEAKDYCLDRFMDNVEKFDYPNYDFIIVDNSATVDYADSLAEKFKNKDVQVFHVRRGKSSREALTRAQNFGRKFFLEGDYEYMLSLESDIFPPKNAIKRLMMWGKDFVNGAYLIGHGDNKLPCITVFDYKEEKGVLGTRLIGVKEEKDGVKYVDWDEVEEICEPGLHQVASAGVGCALIHRSVLEQIRFLYEPGLTGHSDIYFANECYRKKIPIYVDTHIWCYHDNSDWTKVSDR